MERKHIKLIVKNKLAHGIIKRSKRLVLPGFEGVPLYTVSKFFIKGVYDGALNMRATSLAFSFFLAIFPSIIFLFTLIPYIPIENFQDYLFNFLQKVMPKAAFEATEGTIADIIGNPRGGLLSFGFLTALYFSSNGFNAMISAFNETYHDIESRSVLRQRLTSFYMLFLTVLLLAISIVVLIVSELGLNRLETNYSGLYHVLSFSKFIILGGLCYAIISFNYFLGPKRKKGWRFFSVGSMFATILIILAMAGFTYYVNNFGNYNKLYGSIGTLIVIMMMIYIISLILLLGFDLNVSIYHAKKEREAKRKFASPI